MNYTTTILEDKIEKLYKDMGIYTPFEINILDIADSLDIWIHEYEEESRVAKYNGKYYIFLNQNLSPQEKWQDFAHELGHVIKHVGNQHKLKALFRVFQESQANNFMYHFCVPTFMLLNYEISNYLDIKAGVPFISKTFNVTESFAMKRLNHFRNQIQQSKSDKEHRKLMESLYPKAPPYSKETNAILDKLYLQLEKKKGVKQHA